MSPVRRLAPAAAALVLLSCTADRIGGPGSDVSAITPYFSHTAAESKIVITEFLADPSRVADNLGEWFEVYNGGEVDVDLNGWRILSGVTATPESHTIAASVIVPAHGYAVLGTNAGTNNGGVTLNYSYGSPIILNNSNTDWLALKRPDGSLADSIAYVPNRNVTPLGSYSHTAGASRAVVNVNVDNNYVAGNANWILTPVGTTYGLGDRGTPGTGPGGTITDETTVGPVVRVDITPLTASVVATRTRSFSAQGYDAVGNPSPSTYTWSSSDEGVATIVGGVATGVAEGTTTITATAENGAFGTATLNVTLVGEAATITLNTQGGLLLLEGYTKPIFFTIRDAEGETVSPSPLLVWSTPDEAIATVTQNGYVTGVSPSTGSIGIRATAPNGVFGTLNITVIDTFTTSPATYRDHLEFGTPADADPADDLVKTKRQFAMSWNALRGGPNWVSWNLNSTHFGTAARCDCFTSDITLGETTPVHDTDYRGSGYDRGHMVQSESRTRSLTENAATFLMSNILPQAGDNNQGPWLGFENYLNDKARLDGKEVYVIAGGIYGPSPATLKGAGRVHVPDWTWKVAVIMPAAGQSETIDDFGDFEVIAVKMPNDTLPGLPTSAIRSASWTTYKTTVDHIESLTGYDVLASLADVFEIPVEAGDRAPVAQLTASTATAFEGEEVTLNAGGSSDPDGDALTYTYQISDGTVIVGGPSVTHTFANDAATPYTATVTVRDPLGAFHSKSVQITVRNAAPVATLAANAVTVASGDAVDVTAGFTDPGIDDSWTWTLDAGNGAPALTGSSTALPGVATGSFTYTTAGSYTVTFTVVDDGGLADTKSVTVNVVPRTVSVIANPGTINPRSQGTLKLTVFGDAAFDASLVDLSTACIVTVCVGERGNSGETFAQVTDVDGDGDMDLVLHFERGDLARAGILNFATTSLPFSATLTDGRQFAGAAAVRTTTELESAQ